MSYQTLAMTERCGTKLTVKRLLFGVRSQMYRQLTLCPESLLTECALEVQNISVNCLMTLE